jgi:hypothetical protein
MGFGRGRSPQVPKATGGTITFSNGYWVHTFTSSGIFSTNQNITNLEYVVVAGGGSPGYNRGGGGGAGGYRSSVVGEQSGRSSSAESRLNLAANTNHTVTVGAGGAPGSSGSNSAFGSIVSIGGGKGGSADEPGQNGGSGGGSGAKTYFGGSGVGGLGTAGQGWDGANSDDRWLGSPGGGAGANGSINSRSFTSGLTTNITGTSLVLARGGGAGYGLSTTQPANTGNGGNGDPGAVERSGASGMVIVRYLA